MKFSDGFRLNKRGYDVNYAAQAYGITPVENGLNVYVPTTYIQNRGQTLGGPFNERRRVFLRLRRQVEQQEDFRYLQGYGNTFPMGIFKPDGVICEAITKSTNMVLLSLCWILCSIPIVTVGASTAALYSV